MHGTRHQGMLFDKKLKPVLEPVVMEHLYLKLLYLQQVKL